ncbi:hypothetical protein E2C01_064440 [Portunus trituberculatus]|uniref:Uncharacterized protein n=1 Tax=Portunus trituberculatus TaxID=210409 RepID=A0A5B7HN81_PORTR|nr:hypothetical protein [Portunus trituberculatus]
MKEKIRQFVANINVRVGSRERPRQWECVGDSQCDRSDNDEVKEDEEGDDGGVDGNDGDEDA